MVLLRQMMVMLIYMCMGYGLSKKGVLDNKEGKKLGWIVLNVANPALSGNYKQYCGLVNLSPGNSASFCYQKVFRGPGRTDRAFKHDGYWNFLKRYQAACVLPAENAGDSRCRGVALTSLLAVVTIPMVSLIVQAVQ